MKTYIGIDNGSSGSIGIVSTDNSFEPIFYLTPVFSEQNYTKTKKNISRIKFQELFNILEKYKENSFILIERPMINPGRFQATISAVRALEATLIIIEKLQIPYQYIDSKEWQKIMLPTGVVSSEELKKASVDIGCRLFPKFKDIIIKHKDADGILIAEYAKRKNF